MKSKEPKIKSPEELEEQARKRLFRGFKTRIKNKLHDLNVGGLRIVELEYEHVKNTPTIRFKTGISYDLACEAYRVAIENYKAFLKNGGVYPVRVKKAKKKGITVKEEPVLT